MEKADKVVNTLSGNASKKSMNMKNSKLTEFYNKNKKNN